MTTDSVWLGSMRAPVRLAMIVSLAAVALLGGGIIVNNLVMGGDVGMHEMLRPEGRVVVVACLWSLLAAILTSAIYLSDRRGMIEIERTGRLDIIALVLSRIAMMGTVAIVLVMFYEVVARYVFEKPTLWANELSLWMAGFLFLLAGLYAMQQRSHIRIYIIYDIMPRWMQKASDCISVALIWVFVGALIWGGYNEAYAKFMRFEAFGTAWDPPIPATLKPAVLIMGALVAIQALSNLIADWHKAPEAHNPADDIDEAEIEKLRQTLKED